MNIGRGPNRTTVGLKVSTPTLRPWAAHSSQSHHSGIERSVDIAFELVREESQSHHSGIERTWART